jgi:class I fructose-bisphosphate aldolase
MIWARWLGATIYFGSPESKRQIQEVSQAFHEAHERGLFTVLWCYVRNDQFMVDGVNYESSADLTGQADYLGATIEADIVKQKLPTVNRGYEAINKKGKKIWKIY